MRQTFSESIQKKEKKMQTHTHIRFHTENFTKRKEKFKKNPFDLLVMYS